MSHCEGLIDFFRPCWRFSWCTVEFKYVNLFPTSLWKVKYYSSLSKNLFFWVFCHKFAADTKILHFYVWENFYFHIWILGFMPLFSNWLQPDKETTKMDKCVFVCECCSSLISHPGSSWIYIQKASHCLLFVSTACSFIQLKKPYLSHIHAYFLDLAEIPNTDAAEAKVLWSPQSPVNSFMQPVKYVTSENIQHPAFMCLTREAFLEAQFQPQI